MRRCTGLTPAFLVVSLFAAATWHYAAPAALLRPGREPGPVGLASRTFVFHYDTVVKDIPGDARSVDVWIPFPTTDVHQTVSAVRMDVPAPARVTHDPVYGNTMLYVHLANPRLADLPIRLSATVTRRENAGTPAVLSPAERRRDLAPDRLVPTDGRIRALALQVTRGKRTDLEKAHAIYEYVTHTLHYDKSGTGWGRGDAIWACDSKRGNCTDFHSLLIGMARSVGIPARFSIGFPLPPQRGRADIPGYHCWVQLYIQGRGWLPLDSSEGSQNPSKEAYYFGHNDENRVQFTTGRDLVLNPRQQGKPLNFFVYPYVEIDGKPYTDVQRHFSAMDIAPSAIAQRPSLGTSEPTGGG